MKPFIIGLLACGALIGGTLGGSAALAHGSMHNGAWSHQAPWIHSNSTLTPSDTGTQPSVASLSGMDCAQFDMAGSSRQTVIVSQIDRRTDQAGQHTAHAGSGQSLPQQVTAMRSACRRHPGRNIMAMASALAW